VKNYTDSSVVGMYYRNVLGSLSRKRSPYNCNLPLHTTKLTYLLTYLLVYLLYEKQIHSTEWITK